MKSSEGASLFKEIETTEAIKHSEQVNSVIRPSNDDQNVEGFPELVEHSAEEERSADLLSSEKSVPEGGEDKEQVEYDNLSMSKDFEEAVSEAQNNDSRNL